ncbi:MAG TPA: hypothetical protein IAB63_06735 [Candidatus Onthocola gallistercoris]|uniref:Bypass of forespore C C-terminal domain-containing protein n=1 Tax=Candidatus Onthocola gallistercoris TaxID=2840876 RepID=A0A9D1HH98_9FIRM|nr:hypothetical protein [Candidatus Onthocola gallistercoris]
MKKKSICFLLLWAGLICMAYGGSYFYFAGLKTPADEMDGSGNIVEVVHKEDAILPTTRLITETYNLKTGEMDTDVSNMPSLYLGLDREELILSLNDYMDELPLSEIEDGLMSFDVISYSPESVTLRKTYYPDEDFYKYYVVYQRGRIVVYYADHKTVCDYPSISLRDLPLGLQGSVLVGMPVKDDEALYNFLQNYSS